MIGPSDERKEPRAEPEAGPKAQRRLLHRLQPVFGLALFSLALWVLYRELRHYRPGDIARSLEALPSLRVIMALVFTALNFVLLSVYDFLGIRYAGRKLAYRRAAVASFIGFAFSQSLGFPLLTGAPARYRLYSSWGLSAVEISQVIAFYSVTFWLGVGIIGGALLVAGPGLLPPPLGGMLGPVIGAVVLLVVAAYFAWTVRGRPVLSVRDWEFPPPSARLSVAQLLVSPLDWSLAAAVLWVLLPAGLGLSYPAFLTIFVAAQVVGLVSHVPGGLGVFEATLILLLPGHGLHASVLGALVAFRGVYYLLPLLVAAVVYGGLELRTHRAYVARLGGMVGRWTLSLAPYVLAVATFLAGTVLLLSGATPSVVERIARLSRLLPLPLIEASHFLASVAGAALLVLGWGLWRRLDSAWHLTVPLLVAGIVFSLLKGLDWEEASFLFVLLAVLVPARGRFYREGSLLGEAFSPGWIAAVGIVLLTIGMVGTVLLPAPGVQREPMVAIRPAWRRAPLPARHGGGGRRHLDRGHPEARAAGERATEATRRRGNGAGRGDRRRFAGRRREPGLSGGQGVPVQRSRRRLHHARGRGPQPRRPRGPGRSRGAMAGARVAIPGDGRPLRRLAGVLPDLGPPTAALPGHGPHPPQAGRGGPRAAGGLLRWRAARGAACGGRSARRRRKAVPSRFGRRRTFRRCSRSCARSRTHGSRARRPGRSASRWDVSTTRT